MLFAAATATRALLITSLLLGSALAQDVPDPTGPDGTGDGETPDMPEPYVKAWLGCSESPIAAYDEFGGTLCLTGEDVLQVTVVNTHDAQMNFETSWRMSQVENCGNNDDTVSTVLDGFTMGEVGAVGIQIADVSHGSLSQLASLPCGPACIWATLTETSTGEEYMAFLTFMKPCAVSEVDFSLTVTYDGDESSEPVPIVYGQTLGEALPGLQVGVEALSGGMLAYSDMLSESVLVTFRSAPFDQEDAEAYATCNRCPGNNWESWEYWDPCILNDEEVMDEGNEATQRRKRSMREKRDSYTVIDGWCDEWIEQMRKEHTTDMPNCPHSIYDTADRMLTGGDLLFDGTQSSATIDGVANLRMRLSRSPCYYANEEIHGQLLFHVDPLGLVNDTNLCNNMIAIDVIILCPDEDPGYMPPTCHLLVDPTANGQVAEIRMDTYWSLKYDGFGFQHYSPRDFYECQPIHSRLEATERQIYDLLVNRLDKSGAPCAAAWADQEGQAYIHYRMLIDEANEMMRAHEETQGDTDGGQTEGTTRRRRRRSPDESAIAQHLSEIQRLIVESANTDSPLDETTVVNMYCALHMMLMEDSPVPTTDLSLNITNWIGELVLKLEVYASDIGLDLSEICQSDDYDYYNYDWWYNYFYGDYYYFGPGYDQWVYLDEYIDSLPEDAEDYTLFEVVRSLLQYGHEVDWLYGTERLEKLTQMYAPDWTVCPAELGRSDTSSMSLLMQFVAHLKKYMTNREANEDQSFAANFGKDDGSCGVFQLQSYMRNGLGDMINNHLKRVKPMLPLDDTNRKTYCLMYADVLREEMEQPDVPNDIDVIRGLVEHRMNETVKQAVENCDTNAWNPARQEDTLYTFWHEKDNVVYQGIHDPFDSWNVVWMPVMMCECEDCFEFYDYWGGEWTGEWGGEWTGEWGGEWTGEWGGEWTGEWGDWSSTWGGKKRK